MFFFAVSPIPGGDSEENKKDNEEAEMDGELGQEERGTS